MFNKHRRLKEFVKNPNQYVTMPPRVLEMKKELLVKIEKMKKEVAETSSINSILGGPTSAGGRTSGIICSGISYLYVMEALQELNFALPVLKIGMFYPLAEQKIAEFIKKMTKVLIVEELEPYLEKEIARVAKTANPKLQIFGKNLLPEVGELRPEYVYSALSKVINKHPGSLTSDVKLTSGLTSDVKLPITKHLPRFCAGCPYWKVFAAVKKAAPKNAVFGGDIGCYMMEALPPHSLYDYLSCMGSSIGIAHGINKACPPKFSERKAGRVIAFIGDSTFFHSGIPALANCVYNKSNPLIIILDNKITAMTGHQPNPGAPLTSGTDIKIENIVRALGVKNLKIIDPAKNFNGFVKTVKEFLNKKEVSVIISRHPCWLYYKK